MIQQVCVKVSHRCDFTLSALVMWPLLNQSEVGPKITHSHTTYNNQAYKLGTTGNYTHLRRQIETIPIIIIIASVFLAEGLLKTLTCI